MSSFLFKIYSLFQKYRHSILLTLAIITLFFGFSIYFYIYNLSFFQSIYYAIALFAIDLKTPVELGLTDVQTQNHWWKLIYFTGITAILTTLGSILEFLSVVFKEFFEKLHLKCIANDKNHIVVCGFGINNRHYVDSELEKDKNVKIIIIERDKNNPFIDKYKLKDNIAVIISDSANKNTQEITGVSDCEHIIVSVGSDIQNLIIVDTIIKRFGKNKNKNKIKIYLHYNSRSLEVHLDEKDIFKKWCNKKYFVEMFSYNENAARDLFQNKKTITAGVDTITGTNQVKLLIIGFGDLGQEVAIQAAKLSSFYNGKKLKLTVVEKDLSAINTFLKIHPSIEDICDFTYEIMNVNEKKFSDFVLKDCGSHTYIVYALANDGITMESLLHMADIYKREKFLQKFKELPFIAVRFRGEVGLDLKKIYADIQEFGKSKDISSYKMIIDSEIDNLAKELSFKYDNKSGKNKDELWDELSNFHKDSNRAAVDHWLIKKEFIDEKSIDIENLKTHQESCEESIKDLKYKLIDIEHRRWNNFHLLNGWQHKYSKKWNNEESKETKKSHQKHKLHPCIIETGELKQLGEEHKCNYYDNDIKIYFTLDELEKNLKDKKMTIWKPKTPYLAVDGIIEVFDDQDKFEGIVLIERKNEPKGLGIPGGFVDIGESTEDAIKREMCEETSLDVAGIKLLNVYSNPARDERFHVVSTVYTCSSKGEPIGCDDAKTAKIYKIENIPMEKLVFDHKKIINDYKKSKDKKDKT